MQKPPIMDHWPVETCPVIYGLKDPRHDRYCYVGQAACAERRFQQHVHGNSYEGNVHKGVWISELKLAGKEPILEILQRCTNFAQLDAAEREWIRKLKAEGHPLLNLAQGGARNRTVSKFGATRKIDWIDLGFKLKNARDALLHAYCDVSGMLPKNSKEVRTVEAAMKKLDTAKHLLDEQVYSEYPEWDDFMKVFYGDPDEHYDKLGAERRRIEDSVRKAAEQAMD